MSLINPITATVDPERLRNAAAAVKRGARLLDKKLPQWRKAMRRHADEFNLGHPEYCVLGTLEHYSGLRRLNTRAVQKGNLENAFGRALRRLGCRDAEGHGFDKASHANYPELAALWRAEFGA